MCDCVLVKVGGGVETLSGEAAPMATAEVWALLC